MRRGRFAPLREASFLRLTGTMRRSAEPRVAARGEVLFQAPDLREAARIVNLSRGGVCVCGALPSSQEAPWSITLGLQDGREPIRATARLAWVAEPGGAESQARTFGLCFTQLDAADRARLDAQVAVPAVPQRIDDPRPVRLRLDGGPVLRATTESIDDHHAVVSAELPWLRVQAAVEAELDDRTAEGRVAWVGVEQTPTGSTRLRLRLELTDRGATSTRRDQTLPYFSTEALGRRDPTPTPPAPSPLERVLAAPPPAPKHSALRRLVRRDVSGAHAHVASLVKLGSRRRAVLAVLRIVVALLAVSAALWLARAVRHSAHAPSSPTASQ